MQFLRICLLAACIISPLSNCVFAEEWPQWRGPNRDGLWNEKGLIKKFDSPNLKLKWSVPISSGYSGPTIADGRVFVTDHVKEPEEFERVHCFDWKTGNTLWKHEYECSYSGVKYPAGPRAAVTINDGRAYSLGTKGHLFCLNSSNGDVVWSKDLDEEYSIKMPIWGITSSPIVDGDLLIVQAGGEEACLVAFNKVTGKEVWTALKDRASYSAPIMTQHAGKKTLICWTGDNIVGLNPQNGDVYWKQPTPPARMVINCPTPALSKEYIFLSSFYDGSRMFQFDPNRPAIHKIWSQSGENEISTAALHCMISTPMIIGDHIYGTDSYGQFRCLDLKTGKRIWEDLTVVPKSRWATVHMVKNGDTMWMFNERGELIISKLSPKGFEEISRAQLIQTTTEQLRRRGGVCWSHPGFAYKHIFARNDKELVCASLAEEE